MIPKPNHPKSFLSIDQYSKEMIEKLFKEVDAKIEYNTRISIQKNIALLFFQPSTRTRMSFEIASKNIGCNTLLETNPNQSSSIAKGETLYDTLKTLSNYVDAIIMRHPDANVVHDNIQKINIPIVNGGFGNWEHPTQALIDFYTFHRNIPKPLQDIKIALVGDLNTRTAQSLVKLADKCGVSLYLINYVSYPLEPERKQVYDDLTNNIVYLTIETNQEFKACISNHNIDVVYYSNYIGLDCDSTRLKMFDSYYLSLDDLQDNKNKNGHTIHTYSPLPRRKHEMDTRVDDTEHDLSFPAIQYSVHLREILLKNILDN